MSKAIVPEQAKTISLEISGTSQSKALNVNGGPLRIFNDGSATVWLRFGKGTQTATASTDMPVGAGVTEVITMPEGATHVAGISVGGVGKIYFTPCVEGI